MQNSPTLPPTQESLESHVLDWLSGRSQTLVVARFDQRAEITLSNNADLKIPCLSISRDHSTILRGINDLPVTQAWITCGKGNEYTLVCEIELPSEGRVYTRHSLRNPIQEDVLCIDATHADTHGEALRAHFAQPMFNCARWENMLLSVGNSEKKGFADLNFIVTRHLLSNSVTNACLHQGTEEEFQELSKLASL